MFDNNMFIKIFFLDIWLVSISHCFIPSFDLGSLLYKITPAPYTLLTLLQDITVVIAHYDEKKKHLTSYFTSLSLYVIQENAEMVSTNTVGEHGINIVIVYGSLLKFKVALSAKIVSFCYP